MTEGPDDRHPAFTHPPVPQDQPPPRYAKGSLEAELAALIESLEGDRDNWRRIALLKDKHLVRLLAQIAELQAELKRHLGAVRAEADDHDRS